MNIIILKRSAGFKKCGSKEKRKKLNMLKKKKKIKNCDHKNCWNSLNCLNVVRVIWREIYGHWT